jgi:DNA replication protein DnaC
MGFRRENYEYVEEVLMRRRQEAERRSEKNTEEAYRLSPELREIDRKLSSTGFSLVRVAMEKKDVAARVEALKEENLALQARRREILASLGLPENYTDVIPTCSLCRDTGRTDRGMCPCMKQLLVEAGYRSSGLGALLKKQSFDNFSLQYYDGEAKELAERVLSVAKDFAETFDTTGKNLLFVGGTGLGKTHLSTAIAGRAIVRGFDVVYETAQNVIADFEYDRFKSGYGETESRAEKYLDCDLLIMDDLGAEITNQFTVSSLYNIINTRINLGKSMIVNTNLGQKNLFERYDERITSRLFGEFDPYLFRGVDIRRQK